MIRKRYCNEEISKALESSTTESLLWCQWANWSSAGYLHLIDSDQKKQSLESVPWNNIPFNTDEMLKYCQRSIYAIYKPYFLKKLSNCDKSMVSILIKKLLRVCEIYNIACDGDEAASLYNDIVCYLFDKCCIDPDLLLNIWITLCSRSNLAKVTVFSSLVSRHRKQCKSAKILRYILMNAQITHFDFWGAWMKGQQIEKFPFCPVTSALVNGNVEQMTVLLQFGFEPNSQRICTYDKYFSLSSNIAYSWLRKPLEEKCCDRNAIITEVLFFLAQTVACKSYLKCSSLVKCFHLLWSTIPTPFVTKTELQDEIYRRFLKPPKYSSVSYFPSNQDQFLRLCEFYDCLQPEGTIEHLQPRSLQHLCRCSVRNSLLRTWNLPDGIKALPIPNHLQVYLNV